VCTNLPGLTDPARAKALLARADGAWGEVLTAHALAEKEILEELRKAARG
jgi:predicted house-cleaning NTP pyrophosphatase (Maf/HAM1 superfamily)